MWPHRDNIRTPALATARAGIAAGGFVIVIAAPWRSARADYPAIYAPYSPQVAVPLSFYESQDATTDSVSLAAGMNAWENAWKSDWAPFAACATFTWTTVSAHWAEIALGGCAGGGGNVRIEKGLCPDNTTLAYTNSNVGPPSYLMTCPAGTYRCFPGDTLNGATCISASYVPERNAGMPNETCSTGKCIGDPTNASIGNLFQIETDYVGSGVFPLKLARYYNSILSDRATSRLGAGWTHTYSRRLLVDPLTTSLVSALREDGKVVGFRLSGSEYICDANVNERLVKTANGWMLTNTRDEVETYDNSGSLLSIINRNGLSQTLAYNAAGRLLAVTDPFSRALSFTYDALGRITAITMPGGGALSYSFDVAGNLAAVAYPDGEIRSYEYEDASFPNHLTGITDENEVRFATFSYDAKGLVASSEHAGGADKYTFVNSTAAGARDVSVTRFVDASQPATSTYSFTSIMGVAANTAITGAGCPSCGPASTTLDANGNAASETDWNGNRTNRTYDLARNLETSRTEGLSAGGAATPQTRTVTTEWHPSFRSPKRVAEPLRITTYVYNGDGGASCGLTAGGVTLVPGVLCSKSVQATSDGNGSKGFSASPVGAPRAWTYTYNANGQALTVDGPRTDVADTTSYTYYADNDADAGKRGNIATITNALGHVTNITAYNEHGQPLTVIDPDGLMTVLTYDERRRLTSRSLGDETTIYVYDSAGQLTAVSQPDGSFLSYSYDAAHRLIGVKDSLGNRIAYTLDFAGNRIQEQVFDPANQLAQTRIRVYSSLNRLVEEKGAAGQTTIYTYDSQGNVVSVTDPLGHTTTIGYDSLNRLSQVTDAKGGVTHYSYDGLDQRKTVTDPRGLVTTYTRNGLGDLKQIASPDTGATSYLHDNAGNLTTQTDALNVVKQYTYDALNRVKTVSTNTGLLSTLTFTYDTDSIGRVSTIQDVLAGNMRLYSEFRYNAEGRVTRNLQLNDNRSIVIEYGYDAFGRVSSMKYPSGRVVEYQYDAGGDVSAVNVDGQSIAMGIKYHPFGKPKEWTWPMGQVHKRTFDQDGQMTAVTLGPKASVRNMAYDAAGRVKQIVEGADQRTFSYDELDRLTGFSRGATAYTYGYDAVGNRTSHVAGASTYTYEYGASSNRVQKKLQNGLPLVTYAHDPRGSMTADEQRTYKYDSHGRMWQATFAPNTPNEVIGYYVVNGVGQRVRKAVMSGGTSIITRFAYDDAGRLLGEYDGGSARDIREYVYLGDMPLAVMRPASTQVDNAGGYPVVATSTTGTWFSSMAASGYVGPDFQWANAGGGEATFMFTSPTPVTGMHTVYVRWPVQFATATNAPFTVYHANGTTTVRLDQSARKNSGEWVSLGTFLMNSSQAPRVVLTNDADGTVAADAVKIAWAPMWNFVKLIETNHLEAPIQVRAPTGQGPALWRWDPAPFGDAAGNLGLNEDVDQDGVLFTLPLRFPGQVFDQETGLHYNYFRDYDPQFGRYVEPDPIGLEGGMNLYVYASGNPVNLTDPTGKMSVAGWAAVVGGGLLLYGAVNLANSYYKLDRCKKECLEKYRCQLDDGDTRGYTACELECTVRYAPGTSPNKGPTGPTPPPGSSPKWSLGI